MRTILVVILLVTVSLAKAQYASPGSGESPTGIRETAGNKKWSVSRYTSLFTGFGASRFGNASFVSVPMGLQLNRRLNNNLYAFAGVSAAPAYVNFGRSFLSPGFNKTNSSGAFSRTGMFGVYPRAELGLHYVNDERTSSISGSIGIQQSSYPFYNYNPAAGSRANRSVIGLQ